MVGQGSPRESVFSAADRWPYRQRSVFERCRRLVRGCALWLASWLTAVVLLGAAAVPAAADEVDLTLWIAWGGGAARIWRGEIGIEPAGANSLSVGDQPPDAGAPAASPGEILAFEPLGLQPDEPGSMFVQGSLLQVQPRTPRSYDGVRLHLRADRQATLLVHLTPDGRLNSRAERLPIAELISATHNSRLDDQGNQLLVRRDAGDRLRVQFERPSLVFQPGETFSFFIDAHEIDAEPDATLTYAARLLPARGDDDDELWSDRRDVRVNEFGDPPAAGPFSVALPEREGVYDIAVSISKRLLPTSFAPTKVVHQRRVQVVVVDPRPNSTAVPAATDNAWKPLNEIDPLAVISGAASGSANNKSKSWMSLPKWPKLPGSNTPNERTPLDNGKTRKREAAGGPFAELLSDGWQTYWLPVEQTGRPHILEIEYPAGVPQTLGVSLLEPNAAGVVTPVGLDAGFDVKPLPLSAAAAVAGQSGVERYRMVFWPRTNSPLLLLTNRRPNQPAVFGKLRVLAGPEQLPHRASPANENPRLVAAYYDRPIFPENFSASDVLDEGSGRNLDDWQTFLDGGARLTQFLPSAGYNAAMLTVLSDGGAIYPSELLQPTPKFDSGLFASGGQDPVRKDVLEMLFRLFDREGLKLIPALQFATPLPELEQQQRQSQRAMTKAAKLLPNVDTVPTRADARNDLRSDSRDGAAPIHVAEDPTLSGESSDSDRSGSLALIGPDGAAWMDSLGSQRTTGPYYNPLDPRVQQAIRRVVQELCVRYGHHPSFAGVAVQLGPQSFTLLPDENWGVDRATLARFAREERLPVPGLRGGDLSAAVRYVQTTGRERWLDWRCRQLAEMYEAIGGDLTSANPQARLYLAGPNLLGGAAIQEELQPRLPDRRNLQQVVARLGLDPQLYRDPVLLMQPQRESPLASLIGQAAEIDLQQSSEFERMFGSGNGNDDVASTTDSTTARHASAGLIFHEPLTTSLDSFDRVRPFATNSPPTWLAAHIAPVGPAARQRFVRQIAAQDSLALADGGWMALVQLDEGCRELLDVFQRLPAEPFETVALSDENGLGQPVVVRRLAQDGRTLIYAANPSPWPVQVTLELSGAAAFAVETLGSRSTPGLSRGDSTGAWKLSLQPFDLIAVSVTAPNVTIARTHVEFDRQVLVELKRGIEDLRRRTNQLREPQPLAGLANPGFELPRPAEVLPGWDHARAPGTSVKLDTNNVNRGRQALHLHSDGPVVWVRSNPFPTPATGRLAVWVWLRVDDPSRQPPLRLALEGRWNGETYYVPAEVGAAIAGETRPALATTWKPFLLPIQKLPSSGLTDLRVGFDLMGAGDVWIDDVQVFDLWFDKTERNELLKTAALANFHLGAGKVGDCDRILNGYWAKYLREFVPLAETPDIAGGGTNGPPGATGTNPTAAPAPPAASAAAMPANSPNPEAASQPAESASWWKSIVPSSAKMPKPKWLR